MSKTTKVGLQMITKCKLVGAVYLFSLKSKLSSVEFTHDVTF